MNRCFNPPPASCPRPTPRRRLLSRPLHSRRRDPRTLLSRLRVPHPFSGLRFPAVLCLLLPILLPACAKEGAPKQKSGPPGGGGPVPVLAAVAQRKNIPVVLKAIGTVEAANTVSVRARVGGELTRVAFQEGQAVRQGDILFIIDSRVYENALASAVADSARDAAREASAEADVKRYAELLPKEFITQQQYDAAVADAAALKATVQSDQAAIRDARLNLGYCVIRAPISGRTGKINVRQGNLITANGDPLVSIQQITPCYVTFSVPEQQLPQIRGRFQADRLKVEVTSAPDTSRVTTGELSFIDNAVNETTGTIVLKARFPNEDEALWPGQFVDVSLYLAMVENAVVIPAEAVQKGQNGDYVYLIKPDNTAALTNVTQGISRGGEVAILSGVEPGDRVVTDGQLRLGPGAKVDVRSGLGTQGGPGGSGGGARGAEGAGEGASPTGRGSADAPSGRPANEQPAAGSGRETGK